VSDISKIMDFKILKICYLLTSRRKQIIFEKVKMKFISK